MDANKTFQMIEKAFSDKRPVMVTDGTVTRRVVSVGLAEQLYIHTETGEWVEIKRSFCGMTLDGWCWLSAVGRVSAAVVLALALLAFRFWL